MLFFSLDLQIKIEKCYNYLKLITTYSYIEDKFTNWKQIPLLNATYRCRVVLIRSRTVARDF